MCAGSLVPSMGLPPYFSRNTFLLATLSSLSFRTHVVQHFKCHDPFSRFCSVKQNRNEFSSSYHLFNSEVCDYNLQVMVCDCVPYSFTYKGVD